MLVLGQPAPSFPRPLRRPQQSVLYNALAKGIPSFLAAAAEAGQDVPRFVERELMGYLACGGMDNGFARVKCQECNACYIVGFSCKGRGFCPSCSGRRMADLSCHLVDRILPSVPYRQWVLSFPPPLRYLLAYDAKLLSAALRCFTGAIAHWQRHEAKKRYGFESVDNAVTGAVTVIQRFGSSLNLNPHFHTLTPDGVWESRDDALVFRRLGRPTSEETEKIGWRACLALIRHLRKEGRWTDEADGEGDLDLSDDALAARTPLLAEIYGASIKGRLALGAGRGSRLVVLRCGPDLRTRGEIGDAVARSQRFDVHASRKIEEGDRKGLERLCRYLTRPAAANDRFELREDGRITVRLKTAWRDGTTHVVMTPLELTEKLVALIPRPRVNMIRYHGAFAPNAAVRKQVVPSLEADDDSDSDDKPRCKGPGRQAWAMLLKRVFAQDVMQCRQCGGRKTKVRFVTAGAEIRRVLASVGYPNAPGDVDDAGTSMA